MPLTPFVGLSIIAHIGIIIGHKLFNRIPNREANKTDTTTTARFLGFTIVVFMFAVVITAATMLVRESIIESHSSIHFVARYFKAAVVMSYSDGINVNDTKTVSAPVPCRYVASPNDCPGPFNTRAAFYGGSVVDYLAAKGKDYSMEAREKLAVELTIPDYRGTYEQNQTMLMRLFMKFGELPACGVSSCK